LLLYKEKLSFGIYRFEMGVLVFGGDLGCVEKFLKRLKDEKFNLNILNFSSKKNHEILLWFAYQEQVLLLSE
jgi:hypothetical protein